MDVKRFIMYMARWHLSTLVMMVPMNILIYYGYVNANLNLVVIQTIGACVFYRMDRWIMTCDIDALINMLRARVGIASTTSAIIEVKE